jgi:hypothetical protein
MKKCYKCKIEKDELEFRKRKISKDGLNGICKKCHKIKERKSRRLKWKFPDKLYIGENHFHWKGMSAGYRTKHLWIIRHYGKADHCENPDCKHKSNNFDWANISGKYLRERSDYKQMCRSCHIKMDYSKKPKKEFCKHGHKFTKENTYFYNNKIKICRICRRISMAKCKLKSKGVV